MKPAKRAALLACIGTPGMWAADYRWAQKRRAEFNRRFGNGGLAWWAKARYRVHLKAKKGQKR